MKYNLLKKLGFVICAGIAMLLTTPLNHNLYVSATGTDSIVAETAGAESVLTIKMSTEDIAKSAGAEAVLEESKRDSLWGYANLGIANVENHLNIRESAEDEAKLIGKLARDAACEIINSIYNDKGTIMIVNTKNKGAIYDLPYDSSVEISSYITASGPKPINFGKFSNPGQRGYIQVMKSMEELTVEAAVTGDYATALQAFTTNPLVPGTEIARKVLNELLDAHEKYLPQ